MEKAQYSKFCQAAKARYLDDLIDRNVHLSQTGSESQAAARDKRWFANP